MAEQSAWYNEAQGRAPAHVRGKVKVVCVARNVARTAWIAIFEPSTTNVAILLVYGQFDVGSLGLDVIGVDNSRDASTNTYHFDATIGWVT